MLTYLLFKNGKYQVQELDGRTSELWVKYASSRGTQYYCLFIRKKRGSCVAEQYGKPMRVLPVAKIADNFFKSKEYADASTHHRSSEGGVGSDVASGNGEPNGTQTEIKFDENTVPDVEVGKAQSDGGITESSNAPRSAAVTPVASTSSAPNPLPASSSVTEPETLDASTLHDDLSTLDARMKYLKRMKQALNANKDS